MNRPQLFVVAASMLAVAVASIVIVVVAANQTTAATDKNRAVGLSNNTYLRAMTCIASVSPAERTPAYTVSCYNQAEQATGVRIDRYGDAKGTSNPER